MKKTALLLAVLTIVAFIGCNQHRSPAAITGANYSDLMPNPPGPVNSVPLPASIYACPMSGYGSKVVINSKTELDLLYAQDNFFATLAAANPTPVIDFMNKTLIGYVGGYGSGMGIEFTGIVSDGSTVTVNVRLTSSAFCGIYYMETCSSRYILADKINLPVHFQMSHRMYACDGTFTEWNDPTCVPGNVTFTALDPQGYFSDTRENITVTTQAEYDVFLAAHYSGAAPLAIDFNKKALIAVFMGIEPNTCYATDIQEITVDCGDMNSTMNARGWMIYSSLPVITVKIKETYPAPGAMCGQAITRPLKLVLIDRLAGNQLQFFVLPGGPLPAQEGWLPFFSFVYN